VRELVITKRQKRKRGWSISIAKPQASVDQVPWWPPNTILGPNGIEYPLFGTTLVGEHESLAPEFAGFVQQAYKASPVIFACIVNRMMLVSEARFQFRRRVNGRPGDLFGGKELEPLERPWPNGTTADLLKLAEANVSCAGNFFAARRGNRIKSLRPDWTAALLGSDSDPDVDGFDIDAEVLGYVYQPGGAGSGKPPELLFAEDVAHFMPIPDPEVPWRGMSWMTPIVQELLADKQMTGHLRKYLEKGATPNLAVKINLGEKGTTAEFDAWVKAITDAREGAGGNPYQWLFLASVADPVPIGANLDAIDFSKIQGAREVRIAADAQVHPAIAGFSEGLQGSALNSGNLNEAWRQFANGFARPWWRDFAGSMASIITVPDGAELWYDDRDIPALQADETDAAKVLQIQAATIVSLIHAGYDPDSVVDAVKANDLARLEHTGLVSVQLLPPGESAPVDGGANALVLSVKSDAATIGSLMERGWTARPVERTNGHAKVSEEEAARLVEQAVT